ncbi:DoxX family protein [Pseudonocardia humida]|uniref:DoxX family protein n=1 Tax=Pseudonocardia humida TaxID=2800819 RepID=A0ABT0ZVT5_9PSEU|nr:DoxX family protein [Pseudonocardia humida]MCO1654850.1 DoxX family protein [Pseudonocardia humida]
MIVASLITSSTLAALLVASAALKLSHREAVVQSYQRVGVPENRLDLLAGILLAGASGLLAGLIWPPVAVAAAAGLLCYFLIAVAAHVRAHDSRHAGPAAVLALLSAAALALRLGTS